MLALVALNRGPGWLRLWGVAAPGAFTAIGPTLTAIIERPRIGLTMEHDGMLQVESAIDRVLGGQAIYGVDWSGTPMARLPWDLTSGGNPALHHMAYFPLTVLVGIPFRLLSGALGLRFDYRIVLIGFALLGLFAIVTLPIAAERRLMVLAAIYVSPLITLYLWSGRNDIEFLATVLLSLMLLSRGHAIPAAGALGVAVALKPFAWLAVPFLLVVLVMRLRAGRSRRVLLGALVGGTRCGATADGRSLYGRLCRCAARLHVFRSLLQRQLCRGRDHPLPLCPASGRGEPDAPPRGAGRPARRLMALAHWRAAEPSPGVRLPPVAWPWPAAFATLPCLFTVPPIALGRVRVPRG